MCSAVQLEIVTLCRDTDGVHGEIMSLFTVALFMLNYFDFNKIDKDFVNIKYFKKAGGTYFQYFNTLTYQQHDLLIFDAVEFANNLRVHYKFPTCLSDH
jgi:hypothetical protein